jgi:RHS repeat-associated protein
MPETVSVNQVEQGRRGFDGLLRLSSETVNNGTTLYNYQGASSLPNRITTAKADVLDIANNIYLQAPESVSCSTDARLNCTYHYDPVLGLPTADSNQDCRQSVTHDSLGRVITECIELADGTQREASFRYSLLGKLLAKTDFFGNRTQYDYDDLGRLQTITETVSGTQTTTTIEYDGFSRPYKYTTQRGSDTIAIELGFNDVGLETNRVVRFNGTQEFSIVQDFNIRQLLQTRTFTDTEGQTVETFSYDDFERLDSYLCTGVHTPLDGYGNTLTGQAFVYDIYSNIRQITSTFEGGTNNITTFSYSPSNPQRLESLTNTHSDYPAGVTFRYDAAGNLLNDEQGREYAYNALNQLSSVASSDEHWMSHYTSHYTYDAKGRVVSQTVDDDLLYFLYLANQLSHEICDDKHSVIHPMGPGLLARTVEGADDQLHQLMLGNGQGSVIETLSTDGTTGRDKETRQYTPYGESLSVSEAAQAALAEGKSILDVNPFGFNGERQDLVTNLYPLGNGYRAYSPVLGRFGARDSASPFGAGGINAYAYCSGDPANRRDPSGHIILTSLLIGIIVGAAVGAAISAAAEGIQMAINPEHQFDWKQVAIGAALGGIGGGFGVAAQGAKIGVQVGLLLTETTVSGAADFGLNVAAGTPVDQAAINAGVGAVIGLATFGVGKGIGKGLGKASTGTISTSQRGLQANRKFGLLSKLSKKNKPTNWMRTTGPHDQSGQRHMFWGSNKPTRGSEIMDHVIKPIARRKSISDVHIYTGSHGSQTGRNWSRSGHRRPSLVESVFFASDKADFPKILNRTRRKVYFHDVGDKNYSRLQMEANVTLPGHHVMAYCYGINETVLRNYLNYGIQ